MSRILVLALVVSTLSACGASVCTRIGQANSRIFGSKTTCEYTQGSFTGSATSTFSVNKCENSLSQCNAADQKALDAFATCLDSVPACTAGNEKASVDADTACAIQLLAAQPSDACRAALAN